MILSFNSRCGRRSSLLRFSIVALILGVGQVSLLLGDTFTGITGGGAPLENRQPTLGMSYMIAVTGTPPDSSNSGPAGNTPPNRNQAFLGEIKAIPFYYEPFGWKLCEGQSLAV